MKLQTVDADGAYPQQRECINALVEWYKSPSKEFTLRGYAGTGKTHVISLFLKTYGTRINYCITAPTHKALQVIERGIGVKGKTLHSLHGLRMNVDLATFDIEKPQFDPQGTAHIQNFSLIIVDEASMINSGIFELNRKASKEYRTKILYIGDPLQIPPVNETTGKVFTDVKDGFELTDIIRQSKDHDLLELFTLLRHDILNNSIHCIKHLINSKGKHVSNDYKVVDTPHYREELQKHFMSESFLNDIDYIRQGSFTNNSVSKWNTYIRGCVIHSEEQLTIDDVLTAYSNQIDSFRMPIISNSADYIIKDIDKYVDNVGISTFAVNLQNVHGTKVTSKLQICNHNDPNSVAKITNVLNHLHKQAAIKRIPGGFRNYYNFKNSILTMKDLYLNEENGNKKITKDIDYGFAMTIHKLQGSTIKNIAIDLRDIIYPTNDPNRPNDRDTMNRLLYVGLSRATDKAIIHY